MERKRTYSGVSIAFNAVRLDLTTPGTLGAISPAADRSALGAHDHSLLTERKGIEGERAVRAGVSAVGIKSSSARSPTKAGRVSFAVIESVCPPWDFITEFQRRRTFNSLTEEASTGKRSKQNLINVIYCAPTVMQRRIQMGR